MGQAIHSGFGLRFATYLFDCVRYTRQFVGSCTCIVSSNGMVVLHHMKKLDMKKLGIFHS